MSSITRYRGSKWWKTEAVVSFMGMVSMTCRDRFSCLTVLTAIKTSHLLDSMAHYLRSITAN